MALMGGWVMAYTAACPYGPVQLRILYAATHNHWLDEGEARAAWGGEAKELVDIINWKKNSQLFSGALESKGLLWSLLCKLLLLSCPAGNINQSAKRKKLGPSADLTEQLMGMNVDSSLIKIQFKFFLPTHSRCSRWKYFVSSNFYICRQPQPSWNHFQPELCQTAFHHPPPQANGCFGAHVFRQKWENS